VLNFLNYFAQFGDACNDDGGDDWMIDEDNWLRCLHV